MLCVVRPRRCLGDHRILRDHLIPDHLSEAPRNGNGKKAAADGVPLTAILISELCNLKLQLTSLLDSYSSSFRFPMNYALTRHDTIVVSLLETGGTQSIAD